MKRPWSSCGTIPEDAWRNWQKSRNPQSGYTVILAKIRPEYLQNTSPQSYLYIKLLGGED
jgi:hypothetical protein